MTAFVRGVMTSDIHAGRLRIDVDEDRRSTRIPNRRDSGDKHQGDGDDFVAWADSGG